MGGASLLPSSCVHLWSEARAKARRRQSEEMGEVFCYSFTEKGNNQGATFEKKREFGITLLITLLEKEKVITRNFVSL